MAGDLVHRSIVRRVQPHGGCYHDNGDVTMRCVRTEALYSTRMATFLPLETNTNQQGDKTD